MPPKRDVRLRFWEKVEKSEGCWLWTASRHTDGYGRFGPNHAEAKRAHRVAYELEVGPIPPGMLVCHRCDTPLCVRPDHLFLGTIGDNNRDMEAKGRSRRPLWIQLGWGPRRKRRHSRPFTKKRCKRGHAFTPENVVILYGKRRCRLCRETRASRAA
jgi:hypothetical protein